MKIINKIRQYEISPERLDAIWQAKTLLELIKQAIETLKQGIKDLWDMKITCHIDLSITIGDYCLSYFSIRNPHVRIVQGKNGFIQIWKIAFIWGVKSF